MPQEFKCRTCLKVLKAHTSVPRTNPLLLSDDNKAYVEKCIADRQKEIEEGRLGYLDESQFCNVQCAAFYGRATASLLDNLSRGFDENAEMANRITGFIKKLLGNYN